MNDVFELQVRISHPLADRSRHYPIHMGWMGKVLRRDNRLTITKRNLNNCFAYDLVPSPSVITAALRAARRVNDFPSAVRVFEGKWLLNLRTPYSEIFADSWVGREYAGSFWA